MLRVGYLRDENGWLGGISYFRNLLHALSEHLSDTVQPVLIAQPGAALHGLDLLRGVSVLEMPVAGRPGVTRGRIQRRILGRDEAMAALCASNGIDVLSHSGTFGWRFPVATTPWIADFQHRRLPSYFPTVERRRRDYAFLRQLLEGTVTVLSSEAARRDARRFYGPAASRTQVLHFVSQPSLTIGHLASLPQLRAQYGLPERFFFLPNQFWQHKNHRVVLDALVTARERGVRPIVVLTGEGHDYRAPDYYPSLMREVADRGVSAQFLHLGVVPFDDLIALMRHSVAVINPSLFEGWSTTVEEARSLGKLTILSDIDVHREQDPPGARYFDPHDGVELADTMAEVMGMAAGSDDELARAQAAKESLVIRTEAFARDYSRILHTAAQASH